VSAFRDVVSALLDKPVAFHRVLARISGSATAGLMLAQAVYWTKVSLGMDEAIEAREKRHGWFYKSQTEWEQELCLSRCEQETARRQLKRFSFWEEDRRGVPARLYFRVDLEKLALAIGQYAENSQSRMRESSMGKSGKQESGKPAIIKSSESTSESKPPVVPLAGGQTTKPVENEESFLQWGREWIAVKMGRHKRLLTQNEMSGMAGARAEGVLARIRAKGFEARLVPAEEVATWQKATA
jgi:hypothetical protein